MPPWFSRTTVKSYEVPPIIRWTHIAAHHPFVDAYVACLQLLDQLRLVTRPILLVTHSVAISWQDTRFGDFDGFACFSDREILSFHILLLSLDELFDGYAPKLLPVVDHPVSALSPARLVRRKLVEFEPVEPDRAEVRTNGLLVGHRNRTDERLANHHS